MAAKVWSGVTVKIQSALATALAGSGVTKASPGVFSYASGTDPSNGDYMYLSGFTGMTQLDERVVRVANVNGAGNTFELEGVDTTLYDTFTAGNGQGITFGTTLAAATSVNASGGEFEFIDTTKISDTVRTRIPGVASPISLSFTCQWDPADAGLIALKTASDSKAKRCVMVQFADASRFLFVGYIGYAAIPGGSAQELVTTQVVIEGAGRPMAYST